MIAASRITGATSTASHSRAAGVSATASIAARQTIVTNPRIYLLILPVYLDGFAPSNALRGEEPFVRGDTIGMVALTQHGVLGKAVQIRHCPATVSGMKGPKSLRKREGCGA